VALSWDLASQRALGNISGLSPQILHFETHLAFILSLNSDSVRRKATLGIILQEDISLVGGGTYFCTFLYSLFMYAEGG
jgi:hypothetical protein